MASKTFALAPDIPVTITKRSASRSLRLTISGTGEVRVSIPSWTPYAAGVAFARSRLSWIQKTRRQPQELFNDQVIGKHYRLQFQPDASILRPQGRLVKNMVIVTYPLALSSRDAAVQMAARDASLRALKKQADVLLPPRLHELALKHNFSYASVHTKKLSSRWGSCDSHQNIVFNVFLIQLPWNCIDYVILHELTHTQILHHGPDFWKGMQAVLPNVAFYRKIMKTYQPTLVAGAVL